MNQLQIFLPCAAGVEDLLAHEVHDLTGLMGQDLLTRRGGVMARASWRDAMRLMFWKANRLTVSGTPWRNCWQAAAHTLNR